MKLQRKDPPAREERPRLENWKHKVYWDTLEDQRKDRQAIGMYPSVVFKGACYCVLYVDETRIVYTYLHKRATRQFEIMKDLVRVGAMEFEDE